MKTIIDKNTSVNFISYEDMNTMFFSINIEKEDIKTIGYFYICTKSKRIRFTEYTRKIFNNIEIDENRLISKIRYKLFPPIIEVIF